MPRSVTPSPSTARNVNRQPAQVARFAGTFLEQATEPTFRHSRSRPTSKTASPKKVFAELRSRNPSGDRCRGGADALARESVAIWAERDDLLWHGYALMDLAEVLRLAGRGNEAVPVVEQAVELFERKGIVAPAEAARSLLAELEPA